MIDDVSGQGAGAAGGGESVSQLEYNDDAYKEWIHQILLKCFALWNCVQFFWSAVRTSFSNLKGCY